MEGHDDMLRVKAKAGSAMTGATPSHQRRLEQDDKKSDRSTLLCFDASREGFLWLSRYICFPFLLVVLFSALGTAWHYVFVPWQIFDNTMLLLFVAGIHMLSIFVLYLLFKTSLTPAGHVPLDWEPPSEMLESGKYIEPSSRDISSTNWCGKCHSHRPKRAHHCRYCQRCVLVFDHHCPWVNNCVGWANMKYFMLLLFYAAVLSGAICFSFLVRCYQVIWSDSESVTLFTKLVLVGLLMTWSSFGFGIVSLAQAMMLQVVYLTPSCEKAHLKKRVQQSLKMPRLERLGFLRNNITLVFGAHSALWYIPTPPDSDPYNYPSFTDTFIFDDEVPPQENGLMGELTRMEQERQESLTVLRQYRDDDRKAASDDDEGEEARLTTWTAKEATTDSAGFDPALFYGQVPRKGG
jgi:palmitoyltransferase